VSIPEGSRAAVLERVERDGLRVAVDATADNGYPARSISACFHPSRRSGLSPFAPQDEAFDTRGLAGRAAQDEGRRIFTTSQDLAFETPGDAQD